MKLINKKNFFSVFCQVFTVVGLYGTVVDMISYRSVNYTQFNILAIAAGSFIGVLILSQSYRLDHLSPLKIIFWEYCAALACIMAAVWFTSFWKPIHPHGYRDVFYSFSVPYLIGSCLYMYLLRKAVKRQNYDIQLIRKLYHGQKE